MWALLAALERELGCLSGCSAYLTPPHCQGLAPHHDDVEVFILQTEGCKRWRLYDPVDGHSLPATPSADLDESADGESLPVRRASFDDGDQRRCSSPVVAFSEKPPHAGCESFGSWHVAELGAGAAGAAGASPHRPRAVRIHPV